MSTLVWFIFKVSRRSFQPGRRFNLPGGAANCFREGSVNAVKGYYILTKGHHSLRELDLKLLGEAVCLSLKTPTIKIVD